MRSNKLLLAVVVGIATAGAYWFLLLSPKREEQAQLAEQITQKEGEVQQAETLLATYRNAQKTYKANYATLARLGKAVPADDDVRSLVIQLEDAATDSEVDFRSINVDGGGSSAAPTTASPDATAPPGATTVGAAGFSVMPFTLQFEGKYMELSKLFTRLERFVEVSNDKLGVSGRLLRIENFTITPSGDGYPQLAVSVGASTYLVPPAVLPGGETSQAPSAATPASGSDGGPVTTTATTTGALR
jgi:hypothetical protein